MCFESHNETNSHNYNNYKLYDDIGLFCSVIKKTAQEAVATGYPVHAPTSMISWEAHTVAIKEWTINLLQDADYLHGVPNKLIHSIDLYNIQHTQFYF